LFPKDVKKYRIRTTFTDRTRQSALKFTKFIIPDIEENYINITGLNQDKVLRFFDHCPIYTSNLSNLHSFIKPLKQKYFSRIASRMSKQLFGEEAKSCTLFVEKEVEQLEWVADLVHYYKLGYGQKINSEMSCILLQNIISSMLDFKHNKQIVSNLRFAHAETLVPLLTHLGLFRDEEGTMQDPHNPDFIPTTRKWRSSHISSYGANILFVLYECSKLREPPDLLIKILVNEKEVPIPNCSNGIYCPFDEFVKLYSDTLHNCSFDLICRITNQQHDNQIESTRNQTTSNIDNYSLLAIFALIIGSALFVAFRFVGAKKIKNS